jgi:hypothetical protein
MGSVSCDGRRDPTLHSAQTSGIRIAAIDPGEVVTVCRIQIPGIVPAEIKVRLGMLIEREAKAPEKRTFHVHSTNMVA